MTDRPKRKSILEEAEELISGDRRDDYGTAEESFTAMSVVGTVVLRNKLKDKCMLTPLDVALLNIAFKLVRESHAHKRDNLSDIGGYAELADQLASLSAFIDAQVSDGEKAWNRHSPHCVARGEIRPGDILYMNGDGTMSAYPERKEV